MLSVSYLPSFLKTIYTTQVLLAAVISFEPGNQSVEVGQLLTGMLVALGRRLHRERAGFQCMCECSMAA